MIVSGARRVVAILLFCLLPAAVPPTAQGSTLRAEDEMIGAIAYRLALRGAPECPERFPLAGLLFHHLPEYELADQPRLVEAYGLNRGPGILSVLEGSPAAAAGLAAGDTLLALDGRPFPPPPDRGQKDWREGTRAAERLLEDQLRRGPARLKFLRHGEEKETVLTAVWGCPSRIRLARSSQVNAFATDGYVVMTTGLLGFTQDEDELAVAIAHEMAHNILDHPARLDAQKVPRGVLRGIGKNAARVRATEEEADRFAVRLLHRAGYDVSAAIPFWRRFYARFDKMPQLFRTHPSLRARERLIREAIAGLNTRAVTNP
jgi:hypothetical protein